MPYLNCVTRVEVGFLVGIIFKTFGKVAVTDIGFKSVVINVKTDTGYSWALLAVDKIFVDTR